MPLYDYHCSNCGNFREWQKMSANTQSVICPICAEDAPRTVTAPNITSMNPHSRIAHQRNEKSAHEPQMMHKKSQDYDGASHPHRQCNHKHGAGKSHSHGHGRPWMIGH